MDGIASQRRMSTASIPPSSAPRMTAIAITTIVRLRVVSLSGQVTLRISEEVSRISCCKPPKRPRFSPPLLVVLEAMRSSLNLWDALLHSSVYISECLSVPSCQRKKEGRAPLLDLSRVNNELLCPRATIREGAGPAGLEPATCG